MARRMVGFMSGALVLAGAWAAVWSGAARAQQPSSGASSSDVAVARSLSRAFQGVASKTAPAVVHITQLNRVIRRDLFGLPLENQGRLLETGVGTGVIVGLEGYILTNNHVAGTVDALRVKLSDGREVEAKLIGRDPLTDLAVIRVDPGELPQGLTPPAFADSDAVEVGEWVVAMGSPFGFDNTVTAGIVSAKGRSLVPQETNPYQDFLQTDAAINPGNSGGPLLDLEGRLVGINTAIVGPTRGYAGLGFAIPSNMARLVFENILKNKRVVRGGLGVAMSDAPGAGVLVTSVVEDSPAAKGGLRAGDVIVKYDGRPLGEARLRTSIALTSPGTSVPVEVLREGQNVELTLVVGDQATLFGQSRVEALGLSARDFTMDDARKAGYRQGFVGAVVAELDPDGLAARGGLRAGDIIVEARRTSRSRRAVNIDSARDLDEFVGDANLGEGVRLGVVRGNQQGYVDIAP